MTDDQPKNQRPASLGRARRPASLPELPEGSSGGAFMEYLKRNAEARKNAGAVVRGMLLDKANEQAGRMRGWRGVFAVPPASPLAMVLAAFQEETNIPLEIPFFAFLHFVSGMLLDKGVRIEGPIGSISPEMWTVVLAPSGAGKTFATGIIEKASPVKANMAEAVSGAAFLEALAAHPWALWTQDEIAQKLKQIEDPKSPLGDAKEYLLRTYDNQPIERVTKKETIRVERPTLGIFGLNTHESFSKALSAESLLDGFAQRFGFVWAERDPTRRMVDFPIYNVPRISARVQKAFDAVALVPIHSVYRIGPDGEEAFREAFALLGQGLEQDESYLRRAMFRAFKYAALYHVILGRKGDTLGPEVIGWGARAASIHLSDMAKILGRKPDGEPSELAGVADKVERVKALVERRKALGDTTEPRDVARALNGITTAEARILLDMLGVPVKKRGGVRA